MAKSYAEIYKERKNKQGGVNTDTSTSKNFVDIYRNSTAPSVMQALQGRLEGLYESSNSLIGNYNSRYYDEDGKYIDKYRSDYEDWLASVSQTKSSHDKEVEEIRKALENYKKYIGDDSYTEITNYLDEFSSSVSKIYDAANADKEYLSKFKTEADYNDAVQDRKVYDYVTTLGTDYDFSIEKQQINNLSRMVESAKKLSGEDLNRYLKSNGYSSVADIEKKLADMQSFYEKANGFQNYEKNRTLDLGEAQQGIDDLEELLKTASSYKSELDVWTENVGDDGYYYNNFMYQQIERKYMEESNDPKVYMPKAKAEYEAYVNGLKADLKESLNGYESIDALKSDISNKRLTYSNAKRIQENIRLSSVADPESENYDPEFEKYAQYKSTLQNTIGAPIYGSDLYEYVNNQPHEDTRIFGSGTVYPQDQIDSASIMYGMDNKFDDGESTESKKAYDFLEENEIAIFNYYYTKYGEEAAKEYLATIEPDISTRKAEKLLLERYKGRTVPELLFGIYAGADQFESGFKNLFNTNDDYIPVSYTQALSQMVREDLADDNLKWYNTKTEEWNDFSFFGSSLGQVAYDINTTTSNMLPSILAGAAINAAAPGVGSYVSSTLLGASAAGNAYQEMLNFGYDKDQARAYSTLVGASEAGLQYLLGGISTLGGKATGGLLTKILSKVDNALARGAIRFFGSGFSEGFEEGLQTYLEPWFKHVVLNVDYEAASADEILYSSLLGALSAFGLEGPGIAVSEYSTYSKGKNIKADGKVDRLVKLGKTYAPETVAHQLANRINKDTGAYTIGRLFNEVGASLSEENISDITYELVRREIDQSHAKTIAKWMNHVIDGGTLTKRQQASLENNPVLADVLYGIFIQPNSTVMQRNQAVAELSGREISMGVDRKALEESQTPEAIAERMTAKKAIAEALIRGANPRSGLSAEQISEIDSVADKIRADAYSVEREQEVVKSDLVKGEVKASEDGKTKDATTGKQLSSFVGFSKISKDGSDATLTLKDGSEVNAKDISLGSRSDAVFVEGLLNMKVGTNHLDANTANALLNEMRSGVLLSTENVNAVVKVSGVREALMYGYYGYNADELLGKNHVASDISERLRNTAYVLGKSIAEKDAREAQEKIASIVGKNASKGTANGKVHFVGSESKLSNLQKVSLSVLERLSESLGIDIYAYESKVIDGRRVYVDENGKETTANGFYDPSDGSIHIDINSGFNGEGVMLFTAAHELTHFIKHWSPQKFKILADFLMEQYGEKGVSVDALVERKAEQIRNSGNYDLSKLTEEKIYDMAYEEVVANSMETMLADGNVAQKIELLKQKDKGLVAKIKSFFDALVKKIKAAYKGLTPDSAEGRFVAEMVDSVEKLQALFTEALVDASENYVAAKGNDVGFIEKNVETKTGNLTGIMESTRTEKEPLPKMVMDMSGSGGTGKLFTGFATEHLIKGIGDGEAVKAYTVAQIREAVMRANGFDAKQIRNVQGFMKAMSDFMDEAGVKYRFIGLKDVENAKLHYSYNADGSIKSVVLSAMVKNGDYPVNFDFSSICKKRVAMSKLIDKLCDMGAMDKGTVNLSPKNIFEINKVLKEEGFETACLGCFVESKRYNIQEWSKTFIKKWNDAVLKVNPNATYFGFTDGKTDFDNLTSSQVFAIDKAAQDFLYKTGKERREKAIAAYQEKAKNGEVLIDKLSKTAIDKIKKSETLDDSMKDYFLSTDPKDFTLEDVTLLVNNEILGGRALSNKQKIARMVASGEQYQHLLRPSDLLTARGIEQLEQLPNFHGILYGHYGSGTPKLVQGFTPYNSEIALLSDKKGKKTLSEYLYSIAGVRMQSFSDFQVQNVFDYLQMIADLAARKLPAHAYTKEISFAKLLGMTGIKTNLSVMFDIDTSADVAHLGLTKYNPEIHKGEYAKIVLEDEQGKWVYNIGDYATQKAYEDYARSHGNEPVKRFLQSIGFADAVKLQTTEGYTKNCGIIGVGYSDAHIIAMLNDARIRYIIPYHASGLPAEIKVATNIPKDADYTSTQNNMKIVRITDKNGKAVNWSIKEAYKRLGSGKAVIEELNRHIREDGWSVETKKAQNGHGTYDLYSNLSETNDPRMTAENFMSWCAGNETLPLFYQFADHNNYYKMLYDFNVYDNVTEEYAPQVAVTNTYPTGESIGKNVAEGSFNANFFKETVDHYMKVQNDFNARLEGTIDRLANDIVSNNLPGVDFMYSERDSEGNNLSEGQIEYFKDSVVRDENGNLLVVYHGGTVESVFDTERGAGKTKYGKGAYFTVSKKRAEAYGSVMAYYLNIERIFNNDGENDVSSSEWKSLEKLLSEKGLSKSEIGSLKKSKHCFDNLRVLLYKKLGEKQDGRTIGQTINDMLRNAGYDGILTNGMGGQEYIAFRSNQAKLTSNLNPTTNPDIRYQEREVSPITEAEYKDLENHFGTTGNFRVAGYLLTDGKLLDFSGKHWGDTTSKMRQVDHRDVSEVLNRGNNGIDDMISMIGNGNIRLMPEVGGINLAVYPNEKQRRVLSTYINYMLNTEGGVVIDYDSVGGDTVYSKEYGKTATSKQILNDIRNYFNGARQSELMQFHTMYSERVSDKKTLDFLNKQLREGEVTEVYRAMATDDDGNLYPPMAGYVRKNGKKVINGHSSVKGEWEQSTESIQWESVDEEFLVANGFKHFEKPSKDYPNGRFERDNTIFYRNKAGEWKAKFHLDKDNGDTVDAAYAPYIHTSLSVLNDQFTSAYKRDNLVVVKGYVPNSEINGVNGNRYQANFADKPVGKTKWHSGVVAAQMPETRTVILSRYFMPIEIVDDAVMAQMTKEMMKGKDIEIPFNVITPRQRRAMEAIGIRIGEARGLKDPPKKVDVMYSEREVGSTIYIKDGHTAEGETVNFIDLILDGKKLGETRNHKSLTRKWVGIAKDGYVYGRVRFGEPYLIDKNSPEYKDAFIEGTEYDLKDNEQKYYYPILEVEDYRGEPKPIEKNGNYGTYRYSERSTEDISNRGLLANALESAAANEDERATLEEYKSKIELMDEEEQKLRELRAEIKEISFSKGERDTKKLKQLQSEANKIANRINRYDKELLGLEATKPIKDVLAREKAMAAKRQKQKDMEIIARRNERSKAAVVRNQIKAYKAKLENTLLRPTDRSYVPFDLAQAMIDVCELINTDTDLIKPNGEINKAQVKRNLTKEKLQALKDEYEKLKKYEDPVYAGEFDETVYDMLTELRDRYEDKSLSDMNWIELLDMYEILQSIGDTLADARKLIGKGEAYDVYEAGDAIIKEQDIVSSKRKNGKRSSTQKAKDFVVNQSLSPVRNVERMSGYKEGSALVDLFNDFEIGVRRKNLFEMEAKKSFEAVSTGENAKAYESAIYDAFGNKEYLDDNGRKFSVSKMQMMQAILSYEREAANGMNHIKTGGMVFADLEYLRKGDIKKAISSENAHQVTNVERLIEQFRDDLAEDKWAKAYMAAARNFFDGKAKDAINSTMLELKHRIVAKDKNYIPFEVDKHFVVREINAANDIQQTINSYGMLQETKDKAPQPIIMTGLNNIVERHIDQVSSIVGLAIPVRNFNKVWNVRSAEGKKTSVNGIIEENWGEDGRKFMEQVVQDLQGPRVNTQNEIYKKVKSGYIGATFLLNGSVVTKQIGSLFASTSMLRWRNPASMIGNLLYTMANYKKIADEVDKYTASAWVRRQGMSDAEVYTLITEGKKNAISKAINKLPAALNPAKWITAMDSAVALSLWKYAKKDVQKAHPELSGEELNRATASFYDSVIENTQSMTDVLHRPEIQKGSGFLNEALGMFKTDLYQMAGQLQNAAGKFGENKSKENAKALGRTVYSVLASALWGQLMTTAFALLRYKVKPYRDDEDDELTVESWLKRQSFAFSGDIAGYVLPLFGSEIVGTIENIVYGESDDIVDSLALTAINDLYSAAVLIGNSLKEGEAPSADDYKKLLSKSLQVFGVPANNILRIIDAVHLHAKDIVNGEFFSFNAGSEKSEGQILYESIVDGNEAKEEKVKDQFEDQDAIDTALKKALRDNDPRIKKAAMELRSGNFGGYSDHIEAIASEGNFEKDLIASAIRSERSYFDEKIGEAYESKLDGDNEKYKEIVRELRDSYRGIYSQDEIVKLISEYKQSEKEEEETTKETSIYKASDINAALENGDTSAALEVIDDLVKVKTNNYIAEGEKKKDAEKKAKSSVRSSVTSYWKPLYLAAYKSKNNAEMTRIRKLLKATKIYDNVVETCQDWVKQSK